MVKMRTILPAIIVAVPALSGCVADDFVAQIQTGFGDNGARVAATEAAVTPANLAGPNAIPWQLTPASAASVAQGEATLVVEKPGLGRIRGTEKALAQIDQKIVAYADDSKIVSACRAAFDPQARAQGAYSIEAAASGPERRGAKGKTQQVFFRIFYPDPKDSGVEVRQAAVSCTVSKRGELIQATPV